MIPEGNPMIVAMVMEGVSNREINTVIRFIVCMCVIGVHVGVQNLCNGGSWAGREGIEHAKNRQNQANEVAQSQSLRRIKVALCSGPPFDSNLHASMCS